MLTLKNMIKYIIGLCEFVWNIHFRFKKLYWFIKKKLDKLLHNTMYNVIIKKVSLSECII